MFWDKFCAVIDKINEKTGQVLAWGIIAMLGIMMFEVIARYIFHSPTTWAWKVNTQIFSATLILGGGYVLLHKGHVKLDLIYERVSPSKKRIFDLATFPVFAILFILVIWQGFRMAISSVDIGEHEMGMFKAPLYYNKIAFAIGAVLIFLEGLSAFIRRLRTKEVTEEQVKTEGKTAAGEVANDTNA